MKHYLSVALIVLSSCSRENEAVNPPVEAVNEIVELNGEQKAIETFNRYMAELSQNDPATTPYYANGDRTATLNTGFILWNNIWPL